MIKKHERWTALLAAITFAWLMYVSAMPLNASDKTEAGKASAEQAPGFFEHQGPKWIEKNSVLIIVIAVVAIAILSALIHGFRPFAAPRETTKRAPSRLRAGVPVSVPGN